MPTYLRDIPIRGSRGQKEDKSLPAYMAKPKVAQLGWPQEVVRQWLYDHRRNGPLLTDYSAVHLDKIAWKLEDVSTAHFLTMPTGASDGKVIGEWAAMHEENVSRRPQEVRLAWEEFGTWVVPPLLISRELLQPSMSGLQVVEGRTRVGTLIGRVAAGLNVAEAHEAWVGRLSSR